MQYIVDGLLYDTNIMEKIIEYKDYVCSLSKEPHKVTKVIYRTKSGRWFEVVLYWNNYDNQGFPVNEEHVKSVLAHYPKLYTKYFDIKEA